jgi:hypothetical protein
MEKSLGKNENNRLPKRTLYCGTRSRRETVRPRKIIRPVLIIEQAHEALPLRNRESQSASRSLALSQLVLLGIKVSSETHDQILVHFGLRIDN